jgi:hypothetical protein
MTSEEASLSSLTSLSQTVAGTTPGKAYASSSSSSVLEVIDKIKRHISSASSEGSMRSYASGTKVKYAQNPTPAASSSGLGRRREDPALRRMSGPVLPEDPTPAARTEPPRGPYAKHYAWFWKHYAIFWKHYA